VKPLPFQQAANVDILVAVFASFLLFAAVFVGKKHILERWQGVLFFVVYVVYIVALVLRG
jgi:cation:H+ antiporter